MRYDWRRALDHYRRGLWTMEYGYPQGAGDLVMAIHNNQVSRLIDSGDTPLVALEL